MESGYEIHIDSARAGCRVIVHPQGRTFMSTPAAVGMALLEEFQGAGQGGREMVWSDLLATHGVLIGTHADKRVEGIIVPRKVRTVRVGGGDIQVGFPPVFLVAYMHAGRFVRGIVMLIDVSKQAQAGVMSNVPMLVPFPYGNVYSEGGAICWGSVAHADIKSVQELEVSFFGSGFNMDLFSSSVAGVDGLRAGEMPTPGAAVYTHTCVRVLERLLR